MYFLLVALLLLLLLYSLNKAINLKSVLHRKALYVVSITCILIGWGSFMLSMAYFTLETNPINIEWPIEETNEALAFSGGVFVVPHPYWQHVQVYNNSLEYIHGWRVRTGGSFKLAPASHDTFYIYTSREKKRFEYNLTGELISSIGFNDSLPLLDNKGVKLTLQVPFYLKPLVSPFYLFSLFFVGVFTLIGLRNCKPNKALKQDYEVPPF